MVLCGMACAAACEALLLARRLLRAGALLGGLLDLLCGAVFAIGMTVGALRLRIEPFRLYALGGVALGALLFAGTAGLLRRGCARIRKRMKKSAKCAPKDGT